MTADTPLATFVPKQFRSLSDPSRDLPRLAKEPSAMAAIESVVFQVPSSHRLLLGDARFAALPAGSVHLVVTSPPYWTLKEYRRADGQLGWIEDYDEFLDQLDEVWRMCYKALVPGGRLICVVGDVCLSRRKNNGRHTVVPLHASIQERCRALGFDNLAPIIWHKIANATHEVDRGSGGFLGKPYEPNAVIKNDIEYILMQRKGGGYRKPDLATRVLSLLSEECFKRFFRQVWTDLPGASTRDHPAPFPVELAGRLIRMFSFVGDTVLDPFTGTASTQVAAAAFGRNSVGVDQGHADDRRHPHDQRLGLVRGPRSGTGRPSRSLNAYARPAPSSWARPMLKSENLGFVGTCQNLLGPATAAIFPGTPTTRWRTSSWRRSTSAPAFRLPAFRCVLRHAGGRGRRDWRLKEIG